MYRQVSDKSDNLLGFTKFYFRAGNVIIGSCNEFTADPDEEINFDLVPRLLGLAMVPGHHITKMWVDLNDNVVRANSPALEDDQTLENL